MDEATGKFLRAQVGRLVTIIERLRRDCVVESDDRAAQLTDLATDLLVKANELDAKGLQPPTLRHLRHYSRVH